jgi:hypothetical protein
LFLQALPPEKNMPDSSWSRRGVDGRVKPSNDPSTATAIRAIEGIDYT